MNLSEIGFYTLDNQRAKNASATSPLWRNELIITSRCNFSCPYCRGTDIDGVKGDMALDEIKNVVDFWASQNIQNVRLSGGEPTVHPNILEIVKYIKQVCVDIKRIAISTNGYADISLYKALVAAGVNDFSISLDACCSSVGDMMSGGVKGSWIKVIENIKSLSRLTYVTVGMVFSQQNAEDMRDAILFAHSLGVSDIRIISAAQWNEFSIFENLSLPQEVLNAHPILAYRIRNFAQRRNVRGISQEDTQKCPLMLDDMIVKGSYHYPCVIKMREGCSPIGKITDKDVRGDRRRYFEGHDCYCDPICRQNCLDVCVDYNNQFFREKIAAQTLVPALPPDSFTFTRWSAGSVHDFGIEHFRTENAMGYKDLLACGIQGYCFGEDLVVRPKANHVVLLYKKDDDFMWFHIRSSEFYQLFCEQETKIA